MPLLWLSAAFVLGIGLGLQQNTAWWFWLSLIVGFTILACLEKRISWLYRKRQKMMNPMMRVIPFSVLLVAFCLGVFRVELSQQLLEPSQLASYNGAEEIEIVGVIIRPPDIRADAVYLTTAADFVLVEDAQASQPISGKIRVRLPRSEEWSYGDQILLSGKLQKPDSNPDFSYDQYLAGRKIFSLMYYPQIKKLEPNQGNVLLKWIYQVRGHAYRLINDSLPQPEAGLLAGILLGIENDISEQVQEAFEDTGTTHIIAISGFNISIVAAMISTLTGKIFSRKWSLLFAILAVAAYTLLVGAQPPVVRAAIMGVMGLLGSQIGRRQSGINSLGFVAALMLLENPYIIWDAGFQLSFFATLGLVLFADPMQSWAIKFFERYFNTEKALTIAKLFSEYILFTIAAQLTTFPIILTHFGRLSISSFVANPIILPPQPFIMILGGIGVILGLILPMLGKVILTFVWPLLAYTIRAVEFIAKIFKGSYQLPSIQPIWVILFYLLLLGGYWLVKNNKLKEKMSIVKPGTIIFVLLLVNSMVWQMVLTRPDRYLHITLFNIENGPAALVKTPEGRTILINSGSDGSQLSELIRRRIPLLDRDLDLAIMPSASAAASRGFSALLNSNPSSTVALPQEVTQSYSGRQLLAKVDDLALAPVNLTDHSKWQFDEDGVIEMVMVEEDVYAILLKWKAYSFFWLEGELKHSQMDNLPKMSSVFINGCEKSPEVFKEEFEALVEVCYLENCMLGDGQRPSRIIYAQFDWVEFKTDGASLWIYAH